MHRLHPLRPAVVAALLASAVGLAACSSGGLPGVPGAEGSPSGGTGPTVTAIETFATPAPTDGSPSATREPTATGETPAPSTSWSWTPTTPAQRAAQDFAEKVAEAGQFCTVNELKPIGPNAGVIKCGDTYTGSGPGLAEPLPSETNDQLGRSYSPVLRSVNAKTGEFFQLTIGIGDYANAQTGTWAGDADVAKHEVLAPAEDLVLSVYQDGFETKPEGLPRTSPANLTADGTEPVEGVRDHANPVSDALTQLQGAFASEAAGWADPRTPLTKVRYEVHPNSELRVTAKAFYVVTSASDVMYEGGTNTGAAGEQLGESPMGLIIGKNWVIGGSDVEGLERTAKRYGLRFEVTR